MRLYRLALRPALLNSGLEHSRRRCLCFCRQTHGQSGQLRTERNGGSLDNSHQEESVAYDRSGSRLAPQ